MSDPIDSIKQIMARHGAACSVEEFHSAVNVTFHGYESEVYDEIHTDMWQSLPRQFSLLADDCLQTASLPQNLSLLDIGCGTGLATACLLQSAMGPRVRSVDLLDTSPRMLERAGKRAESWNIPVNRMEGLVESLVGRGKTYDVIVTCSVLHHVPDLAAFLRAVRSIQAPGGVFLHLQDPNGDYLSDPECKQRMAQLQTKTPEWLDRLRPARVLGRLYRELTGKQGQDYISKTNRDLVAKGIVQTPLSVEELFTITDIHVHDDQGISITELRKLLPDYELISQRSYAFFGQLASALPPKLRETEEALMANRAPNGFHAGAAWKLPLY